MESGDMKRRRDEESESSETFSPVAKRLREDLFLDMLDDDVDAGEDLESVMKSLEEEIGLPSPSSPPKPQQVSVQQQQEEVVVVEQPDLGYLLEASDDELGLPPTLPSSSSEGGETVELGVGDAAGVEVDGVGFSQIWGFDDDFQGYDGFGFGIRPEERDPATVVPAAATAAGEERVVFDGGLFDYADVLCGPTDFSDLAAWRSETLPAV